MKMRTAVVATVFSAVTVGGGLAAAGVAMGQTGACEFGPGSPGCGQEQGGATTPGKQQNKQKNQQIPVKPKGSASTGGGGTASL